MSLLFHTGCVTCGCVCVGGYQHGVPAVWNQPAVCGMFGGRFRCEPGPAAGPRHVGEHVCSSSESGENQASRSASINPHNRLLIGKTIGLITIIAVYHRRYSRARNRPVSASLLACPNIPQDRVEACMTPHTWTLVSRFNLVP